jgi:DNA-binding CsgD family transcriptional regulator
MAGVPFVGRERERADLLARLDVLRNGRGSVTIVIGEAGIGKSALVESVLDGPALRGRCSPEEGTPAFWPWQTLVPAELLTPPDTPGASAAEIRFTLIRRVTEALPDGAVIALDDVQWADENGLALLRHLAGALPARPICLFATVRDPDGARPMPEGLERLLALSDVHVHRLAPLPAASVGQYVRSIAGDRLDPSWPDELHRRTGGNPLYLRELTRVLADDGRLAEPAREYALPAELRRLAALRMAGVGAPGRRLIGAASVLGDEVDLTLLRAVAAPDEYAAVSEAVAAGILVEDPAAPDRLRFNHTLVRQAHYDLATRDERLGWHAKVAEATADPAERARHLVRTAVDDERRRTALDACRDAALDAERRLAYEAAAYWYGQAVGLAPTDALRADLMLNEAEANFHAARFVTALERAAAASELAGRLGRADLAARAAVAVHDLGGTTANQAIVVLCARALEMLDEPSSLHARVLAQYALALSDLSDADRAGQVAHRAIAMAERLDPSTAEGANALIDALRARHTFITGLPDVAERLEIGTRVRALATTANRPNAMLWSHIWRIEASMQVGAIAEVDNEIAALAAHTDRLAWRMGHWHVLRARAAQAARVGDFEQAEAYALEALAVAEECQDESGYYLFLSFADALHWLTGRFDHYRDPIRSGGGPLSWMPIADALIAHTELVAGDPAVAAQRFARTRPLLRTLPIDGRRIPVLFAAGEVAAGLGDQEMVRVCYEQLLPFRPYFINSASGNRGAIARGLGVMAAALGDLDEADRLLGDAVALERRTGSAPFEALALVERAKVLVRRGGPGDRDRAGRDLDKALLVARRLAMNPLIATAEKLAAEVAGVKAGAATLTAREREIADLVAEGLANRAIAERLVVSERTVETHVRGALNKLDLSNRTQLAAWVTKQY